MRIRKKIILKLFKMQVFKEGCHHPKILTTNLTNLTNNCSIETYFKKYFSKTIFNRVATIKDLKLNLYVKLLVFAHMHE